MTQDSRTQRVTFLLALIAACSTNEVLHGVDRSIEVDPTELVFPDTFVGRSTSRSITLTNTGGVSLDVALRLVRDASLFSASRSAVTIDPGQRQALTVVFNPQSAGAFAATLEVAITKGAIEIALKGTSKGVPICPQGPEQRCANHVFDFDTEEWLLRNDYRRS